MLSPDMVRLSELFGDTAYGRFPKVDGAAEILPRPRDLSTVGWSAVVVEFTGHAVVLTDLDPEVAVEHGADGFGGASSPEFLRLLCGADGRVEHQAVVYAGLGEGGPVPERTEQWDEHPRVRLAQRSRTELAVFGDDAVCVTYGRGLAGRWELGIEVAADRRACSVGSTTVDQVRRAAPHNEPVFGAAAPGNVMAARTLLAAGLKPVAFEIVIEAAGDRLG